MKTKSLILSVTGALLAGWICAQAAPTAPGGPVPMSPSGSETAAPGGPAPIIPRTAPGPRLAPNNNANQNINHNRMNNVPNANNPQSGAVLQITNSQNLTPPNINTQALGGRAFAHTNFFRPYTNYFRSDTNYYRPYTNFYRPYTNFYRPYTNYYRPYTNVPPMIPPR